MMVRADRLLRSKALLTTESGRQYQSVGVHTPASQQLVPSRADASRLPPDIPLDRMSFWREEQ